MRAWLGLGSNEDSAFGDRVGNIQRALQELAARGTEVLTVSPLYETEPWGVTDQPRFLNGVCLIETDLGPLALLDTVKAIERALGREPGVRYGPRPIDLDILLYDDLLVDTSRLQIPHPGMLERSTVLVPLADVAPELRHPVTGRTVAQHLRDLGPTPDVAPYPPGLPDDESP